MTTRRWLLVAASVAVALVIWLLLGRANHEQANTPATAPERSTRAPTPDVVLHANRSSAGVRAVNADAKAPVIDEVTLEKSEVCEGEENLVTVKAHAPDADDQPFLRYMVGGADGMSVPVRGVAEPGVLDHVKIVAFGRNGVSTTVDLPRFTVKPCKVEHQLFVTSRLMPNTAGEYELSAHLDPLAVVGPAKRFDPIRYIWKFGDGSTSETSVPVETHDYSHRTQTTLATTFLVSCTAVAKTREQVEGRAAIQLNNSAFETFEYKGIVLVSSELTPRFPEPSASGVSTQRVRLWHAYSHPVRIEHLKVMKLVMGKETQEEEAPLDELGVSVIAPGQVVEGKPFHFDGAKLADVYGLEYHVEGTTDDGVPARGNFSIMRPAKPPTPDDHTTVSDPLLKAKILRARELLGQQYVTDEDIWRLEREGLMNGLDVESGSGARPSTPRPPAPTH